MELIQTENWTNNPKRSFEIYTFRDNTNDRLVITAAETTEGRRDKLKDIQREILMKGEWRLKPHEYTGYQEALAEVKTSVLIHCHVTEL